MKSKTDGSMRWAASDSSTPNFTVFIILGHNESLIINFPTNRTTRAGRVVSIQPSLFHPVAIVPF
jgi:hypothetical protein